MPKKDRQQQERRDRFLMRTGTVALVLLAVAFIVIMLLIIATHA